MSQEEKSAEDFKNEGNQFHVKQKFFDAIRCYTQAIELDPSKAVYYGNRSASYLGLDKWTEALGDAKKAIELDGTFAKGYLRAGKATLAMGDLAAAKTYFQKTREYEAAAGGSEISLINTLERDLSALRSNTENLTFAEESVGQVNRLISNCPGSADFQLIQAQGILLKKVYMTQNKLDEALGITTRLATKDRSNPHVTFVRGLIFYNMGESDKAVTHFQETLKLDPDFRRAQLLLKKVRSIEAKKKEGNQAFTSGQYTTAVDIYSQALEIDPVNKNLNAVLFGNRAAAYMKMKDYTRAITDCNSSTDLNPHYHKSIKRRAECNMELEQYEDAMRDFQSLMNADPENREYADSFRRAQLAHKKAGRRDLYKILEVSKTADQNEIKKSYRKLALQWHPDKHTQSTEAHVAAEKKFKEIGEAYAILSDEQKRQHYDAGAEIDDINQGTAGMHGGHGGIDPNQIFQMFFGGGGGGFPGGGFPGGGFHSHGQRGSRGGRGGFPGGGGSSGSGFEFFYQ